LTIDFDDTWLASTYPTDRAQVCFLVLPSQFWSLNKLKHELSGGSTISAPSATVGIVYLDLLYKLIILIPLLQRLLQVMRVAKGL
jgi:hypothetical protein